MGRVGGGIDFKPFTPCPVTLHNPPTPEPFIWHGDYIGQEEGNDIGRRMRARYLGCYYSFFASF